MPSIFRVAAIAAAIVFAGAAGAQTVGFAALPPGSILHAQACTGEGLSIPATIDVVVGVGAHVADGVVYQFVKAMRENKKGLVAGHPNFNQLDEAQAGRTQPSLPHHPAAIQYFKEVNIWKG